VDNFTAPIASKYSAMRSPCGTCTEGTKYDARVAVRKAKKNSSRDARVGIRDRLRNQTSAVDGRFP